MEDKDTSSGSQTQYRGIRRRKWGKWVSEIRVPGSRDRLWLGSFSTPEAAALAHDVAFYCLHRPSSLDSLNFPHMLPPGVASHTSPRSIQRAASDAGMALDAQFVLTGSSHPTQGTDGEPLSISVYDYLDDDSL